MVILKISIPVLNYSKNDCREVEFFFKCKKEVPLTQEQFIRTVLKKKEAGQFNQFISEHLSEALVLIRNTEWRTATLDNREEKVEIQHPFLGKCHICWKIIDILEAI